MKKLTLILLTFTLLAACKKTGEDAKPIDFSKNFRIKTMWFMNKERKVWNMNTYKYNNSGFIVQQDSANYKYQPGRVIEETPGGVQTVYYLNKKGLADSVVKSYFTSAGGPFPVEYIYAFTYNDDGYCIESREYDADKPTVLVLRQKYTLENGNTTLMDNFTGTGSWVYEDVYTYDAGHTNSTDREHFGMSFMGKWSKNPFVHRTYVAASYYYDISYHYDSLGRIDTAHTLTTNGTWVLDEYRAYEYY